MKSKKSIILAIISAGFWILLLTGCAGFTSPARVHELDGQKTYWFDYDTSRRGAFLLLKNNQKNNQNEIKICAEPSPDVALNILNSFAVKVPVERIPVEGQMSISQQVIQLAGRSQTLLFLRESLYRLCEISLNNNFTKDEIKDLYKEVIQVSSKLAEAEFKKAEAELKREENRYFELRKTLFTKVEEIINYVNKGGKVDEEKFKKLIHGTVMEEGLRKFYQKPIEEFRKALKGEYAEYIEALWKRIKDVQ